MGGFVIIGAIFGTGLSQARLMPSGLQEQGLTLLAALACAVCAAFAILRSSMLRNVSLPAFARASGALLGPNACAVTPSGSSPTWENT